MKVEKIGACNFCGSSLQNVVSCNSENYNYICTKCGAHYYKGLWWSEKHWEIYISNETDVIRDFYELVCYRAEQKMLSTGKLEGAHYAAMRELIAARDLEDKR